MSFLEINLYSDVLRMNMDVNMVLPAGNSKIKTVWLLHGGHGDHNDWVRKTHCVRIAETAGIALIMPNVHYSCYVDMKNGLPYARYLGEELPVKMRAMFTRLSEKREDNYISGFSNGGYGSLRMGLLYPEVFGFVGAFAAGDHDSLEFVNDGSKVAKNRIALFGPEPDIHETSYSVKYLAAQLLKTDRPRPVIWHACGEFDPWYKGNRRNRRFFEGLEGDPFSYRYKEYPGMGHTAECREQAFTDFVKARFLGTKVGDL
ncbi:MAG: esterase family protein [Treponema sp.]|jgi:S-formylglutathione hydrolase FrmB|nr:esterase family protein [Treponema sp.]